MIFSNDDLYCLADTLLTFVRGEEMPGRQLSGFSLIGKQGKTSIPQNSVRGLNAETTTGKSVSVLGVREPNSPLYGIVKIDISEFTSEAKAYLEKATQQEGGDVEKPPLKIKEKVIFHLLLPGHESPTHPRILPKKEKRKFRRMIGARKLGEHHPRRNLVACELDRELLVLQLAAYVSQKGCLSEDAEREATLLFEKRFRDAVGRLNTALSQEGNRAAREREVLYDAWRIVQKGYCVPGEIEGFSHYVRRVIGKVKRPTFRWDGGEVGEDPWPQAAAHFVGIPERTFYSLIGKGIIPATKMGEEIKLQSGWYAAALQWQKKEGSRKQRAATNKRFAEAWAAKQNICLKSATTQIKRWRARGLDEQEITKRISLSDLATHSASQASIVRVEVDGIEAEYNRKVDDLQIHFDESAAPERSQELDDRRCVWYSSDGSLRRVELLQVSEGVEIVGLPEQKLVKKILDRFHLPSTS